MIKMISNTRLVGMFRKSNPLGLRPHRYAAFRMIHKMGENLPERSRVIRIKLTDRFAEHPVDLTFTGIVTDLDDVTVGDGAILAAHSVITKDVPPYAFVAGNPGVVKRYRFSPEIIEKLLKIKWWDWPKETIQERMPDFVDINTFIEKYAIS